MIIRLFSFTLRRAVSLGISRLCSCWLRQHFRTLPKLGGSARTDIELGAHIEHTARGKGALAYIAQPYLVGEKVNDIASYIPRTDGGRLAVRKTVRVDQVVQGALGGVSTKERDGVVASSEAKPTWPRRAGRAAGESAG